MGARDGLLPFTILFYLLVEGELRGEAQGNGLRGQYASRWGLRGLKTFVPERVQSFNLVGQVQICILPPVSDHLMKVLDSMRPPASGLWLFTQI